MNMDLKLIKERLLNYGQKQEKISTELFEILEDALYMCTKLEEEERKQDTRNYELP